MKVLTFSRVFPAYHPHAGQATHFVEKLWKAFPVEALGTKFHPDFFGMLVELNAHLPYQIVSDFKKEVRIHLSDFDAVTKAYNEYKSQQ